MYPLPTWPGTVSTVIAELNDLKMKPESLVVDILESEGENGNNARD